MTQTRYEDLQDLVRQYGQETEAFAARVHEAGLAILDAYRAFLGGPESAVNGVPAFDPFEPRVPYRDAMFSNYMSAAVNLEPIFMGLSTEIGNTTDDGAIWVRTVIEFHPAAEGLEVLVGDRQHRTLFVTKTDRVLQEICEAVYRDVTEVFSLDLNEARGSARVGFVPPPPG
jgi:hypothetical protein